MPENASPKLGWDSKLSSLHSAEEDLRTKAERTIAKSRDLQLHLKVVEAAMDLADVLRQHGSESEDDKVTRILGMRCFNALGAASKLALSGYFQNAALILRDILETVFLLDLFRTSPELRTTWRLAGEKERQEKFAPVSVRKALDDRDGFTSQKRKEIYKLFSELAAHPSMKSAWMMRPEKSGDAVIGPFMESTSLLAILSEMGRLAIQVGEQIFYYVPSDLPAADQARREFAELKNLWIKTFYHH